MSLLMEIIPLTRNFASATLIIASRKAKTDSKIRCFLEPV
jgi:hypothetical protein